MVAAGVYMLCRTLFLFNPQALVVVAWIGAVTALLAAVIAVQQDDIKRILAYSTLSQLGYMVMTVGLGGPTPAMYHLTTHAFFKALLFLGAGSVIHRLHHEQNIWKMGGLWSRMPVTFWTFVIGTAALAGVPPFSGFYSKDEILAAAYHRNFSLFVLAWVVAVLTTFYMLRLVLVVFLGRARTPAVEHAHESPGVMTVPLLLLALASVLAGFWGIGDFYGQQFGVSEAASATGWAVQAFAPFAHAPVVAFASLGAVILGVLLAWPLYAGARSDPLPAKLGGLARAMRQRFYFDEVYERIIASTQDAFAAVANAIDQWIVDGVFVRGAQGTTELFGRLLRLVQTGNLQTYAFLFAFGLAVLLFFVIGR
jgi:NADH-quinone oxidoreductase subunit L